MENYQTFPMKNTLLNHYQTFLSIFHLLNFCKLKKMVKLLKNLNKSHSKTKSKKKSQNNNLRENSKQPSWNFYHSLSHTHKLQLDFIVNLVLQFCQKWTILWFCLIISWTSLSRNLKSRFKCFHACLFSSESMALSLRIFIHNFRC